MLYFLLNLGLWVVTCIAYIFCWFGARWFMAHLVFTGIHCVVTAILCTLFMGGAILAICVDIYEEQHSTNEYMVDCRILIYIATLLFYLWGIFHYFGDDLRHLDIFDVMVVESFLIGDLLMIFSYLGKKRRDLKVPIFIWLALIPIYAILVLYLGVVEEVFKTPLYSMIGLVSVNCLVILITINLFDTYN